MAKPFTDLTGDELEEWLKNFFRKELNFEHYYRTKGQINLSEIDPSQSKGEHLEIDGLLLINKTCIFCEVTSESSQFKRKIKKFTRNANLFMSSKHLTFEEKLRLFGIPEENIEDFSEAKVFKYVYFGTSNRIQNEDLSPSDFPDYPLIQKDLFIIKPNTLEYLRQLSNLIGPFSRYDFLAVLNFTPQEFGETEETIKLDFLKAENKYITGNEIKADVYLLKFTVEQLLRIARVSRYEGIPFIFEEDDSKHNYQRLLIQNKLDNISRNFIKDDKRKLFPNTITIVLGNDCKEETEKNGKKMLSIPKRFSSIDIIDGQHRLFGYTQENIKQETLIKSEILATAIKFQEENVKSITKDSAKVFVEINSNQAKVKNNLIYLIKYDVLGEKDDKALSGKIILLCNNSSEKNALGNLFLTNTLNKKNKFNHPSIPITTIVDNDLVPFIKGIKTNKIPITEEEYKNIFGKERNNFKNSPLQLCKKSESILSQYFGYVQQIFNKDWKKNAETHLLSAKFITAFIRLLRFYLFDQGITVPETKKKLEELKKDVDKIVKPKNSETFQKKNNLIPSTKHGINTIFEFLINTDSFTPK